MFRVMWLKVIGLAEMSMVMAGSGDELRDEPFPGGATGRKGCGRHEHQFDIVLPERGEEEVPDQKWRGRGTFVVGAEGVGEREGVAFEEEDGVLAGIAEA
jgi:hypothetical protein